MSVQGNQSPNGLDTSDWPLEIVASAEGLFTEHYDELLTLARRIRNKHSVSDTLLTGDLIHESFLKLEQKPDWKNKGHFFSSVALAMRQVIVDNARRKQAAKRGGSQGNLPIEAAENQALPNIDQDLILSLQALLSDLGKVNKRLVQVVDCRFFAGFTEIETAEILNVDPRTIRRDWNKARSWFVLKMGETATSAF